MMTLEALKQTIQNKIETAEQELQSLIAIDNELAVSNYADILRAAKTQILSEFLPLLPPLLEANSEESLKENFEAIMHTLHAKTKDTALDCLSHSQSPLAILCFDLFNLIYQDGNIKTFLQVFSPEVLTVLQVEVTGKNDIDLKAVSLDDEEKLEKHAPQSLIISGAYAFSCEQAMRGNEMVFKKLYKRLSEKYPDIYAQLKTFNESLAYLYQQLEQLAQQKTLREALQQLYQALVAGGNKITGIGEHEAGSNAYQGIAAFFDYLAALPEELKNEFLALRDALGNHNLEYIIKQLQNYQCVEVASGWVDALLSNPQNTQILNKRPGMAEEKEREIKTYLDKMGKLNSKNNEVPKRTALAHRDIPSTVLSDIFAKIEIQNIEALAELLHAFSEKAIYQVIHDKYQGYIPKNGWKYIFILLDNKQTQLLIEVFAPRLKTFLNMGSVMNVKPPIVDLIESIRLDQIPILLAPYKESLVLEMGDLQGFLFLLSQIPLERGRLVCETLKTQLEPLITSYSLYSFFEMDLEKFSYMTDIFAEDLTRILIALDNDTSYIQSKYPQHYQQLFQNLFNGKQLPTSPENFALLCQQDHINHGNKKLAFALCKHDLAKNIKTLDQYIKVIIHLDGEMIDNLNAIREAGGILFNNYLFTPTLINGLGLNQFKSLIPLMEVGIRNAVDPIFLVSLISHLDNDKLAYLNETVLKIDFNPQINSIYEFARSYSAMVENPERQKMFLELCLPVSLQMIQTNLGYIEALLTLGHEEKKLLNELIMPHTASMDFINGAFMFCLKKLNGTDLQSYYAILKMTL